MKQCAIENGLGEVYEAYEYELEGLREFYGDYTDDLEFAIAGLQDDFPELFGEDEPDFFEEDEED